MAIFYPSKYTGKKEQKLNFEKVNKSIYDSSPPILSQAVFEMK